MKALSGYLPVEGGGAIEFSLILNSAGDVTDQSVVPPDLGRLRRRRWPTYPAGPTPAELGPADQAHRAPMAVLPMFPLGKVLLPGGVCRCTCSSPRYRQLVVDCLATTPASPSSASSLIERGSEVGGGDAARRRRHRRPDGRRSRPLDDGRYALVTVGTRRIRVLAWLPDDPYPLADVEDWPDAEPTADGLPRARRRR